MVFEKARNLAVRSVIAVCWLFLETHPFITRHDYSGITGLLKNKALNDLNLLVEKGYLNTVGQGSHKVYVRADNKEVTE